MGKTILSFLIVSCFALVAGFALLHKGLIPTHDGEFHVIRFYEFSRAFFDGDFYPRWASDLNAGYGVPLFNYVYPLPNYFALLIHAFGFSFIESFKIQMFLSLIIGAIFFYLWSREFWGELGGIVSSVFYTFTPYHFVDVYVRGSVGEVLALAIFPALLWSVTKFAKTKKQVFFPLSSVFFALLIFSHNILALMFSAFLVFYVSLLVYKEKDKRSLIYQYTSILVLGLGLSSIFWLPALLEKQYVVGLDIYEVSNNFPLLYQLLIPTWGSGLSEGGLQDQISFQIGVANLTVMFLCPIFLLLYRKKDNKKTIVLFFLFWFSVVFLLMLRASEFIWETIPLMNYFQFPWRFLSLEMIITSFLAGGVVYFGKAKKILAVFLIGVSFILGIGYAKVAYYMDRQDNYYIANPVFIDGTNSPGNAFGIVGFNRNLKKADAKFVFNKGSGTFNIKEIKSSEYFAVVTASEDSEIVVNTAHFPGWGVFVEGKRIDVQKTQDGLISFQLPEGTHEVMIRLEDTAVRKVGIVGFYLALLTTLILFVRALFVTIKR
ncbi:MAG: 6-pyruvoyl-tetrahydropterin synthase-related protein [Candidatus Levyibacteriota bacterium]